MIFFFKQKTAYEMRISDWSSDVCSSDLQIWAPRYRQATFGAFLTGKKEAQMALSAAYRDVAAAFDYFLSQNEGRPLILAAHSQGSLHLIRLLHEKVAGTPLASQKIGRASCRGRECQSG